MKLDEYRRKRDFHHTNEPAGDVPPEPGALVLSGAARSDDDPVLAATGRELDDDEAEAEEDG